MAVTVAGETWLVQGRLEGFGWLVKNSCVGAMVSSFTLVRLQDAAHNGQWSLNGIL